MQIPKRHLSKHRVQRLLLWTLAMLAWLEALLRGETKRFSFRKLRQRRDYISLFWLTQLTHHFIIIRACQLAHPRKRRHVSYGRARKRRHFIRSLIGSRLRATLKHADPAEAVAKLIHALRNLDACAAHIAQRLKRGLTRLNAITATPASDALAPGAPASPPAFANSS